MENPILLTKDEEFWMVTGVVLRNWTALQIGLNESSERLDIIRSKVNSLLQSTIDGVLKIKANKCDWNDVADFLDSFVYEQFDVILDDDSDSSVVCHLVDLHSLIEANDRAAIITAMNQFQDHRHVLSGELYQPKRVIQKDGAPSSTSNSSQNNITSVGQPAQQEIPSANFGGTCPAAGGSASQYTVFNPSNSHGSTAIRNTKLDLPEREGSDESMSSDTDGEVPSIADSNEPSSNRKMPENNDDWMVVERRRKKK